MKTKSKLAAGMLVVAAAFSLSAMAQSSGPDASAGTSAQQSDAKPKVKPHSHMEEKMGAVAKAPKTEEAKPSAAKKNPANDFSKHYHPRDGGK
jgi:hypothetical protein